ncbi:Uncharacterised protein [Yersinia pseudotuberculosis]|nr:Uncharacterised protein [Yersinia pseudotuberculosis]
MPFVLEVVGVLAARTYPNHLRESAHRDSFAGCLPTTPITLGMPFALEVVGVLAARTYPNHLRESAHRDSFAACTYPNH